MYTRYVVYNSRYMILACTIYFIRYTIYCIQHTIYHIHTNTERYILHTIYDIIDDISILPFASIPLCQGYSQQQREVGEHTGSSISAQRERRQLQAGAQCVELQPPSPSSQAQHVHEQRLQGAGPYWLPPKALVDQIVYNTQQADKRHYTIYKILHIRQYVRCSIYSVLGAMYNALYLVYGIQCTMFGILLHLVCYMQHAV